MLQESRLADDQCSRSEDYLVLNATRMLIGFDRILKSFEDSRHSHNRQPQNQTGHVSRRPFQLAQHLIDSRLARRHQKLVLEGNL